MNDTCYIPENTSLSYSFTVYGQLKNNIQMPNWSAGQPAFHVTQPVIVRLNTTSDCSAEGAISGSSIVLQLRSPNGTVYSCTPINNETGGSAGWYNCTWDSSDRQEGNWSVNIAFEGNFWSQVGTAQNLTLKPGNSKTLTWNGHVPANATIDSVARLVVYYSDGSVDSFKALNWWIHVVPGAELTIKSSSVE